MKKLTRAGKNVKLSLAQATDSVRDKFRKLRSEDFETSRLLEEQFKPITKKLGVLIKSSVKKKKKKEPLIESFMSNSYGDDDHVGDVDDDSDESVYLDVPDTPQNREEEEEVDGGAEQNGSDDDVAATAAAAAPRPPATRVIKRIKKTKKAKHDSSIEKIKKAKKNAERRVSQRVEHSSAVKKQLEREIRLQRSLKRTKKHVLLSKASSTDSDFDFIDSDDDANETNKSILPLANSTLKGAAAAAARTRKKQKDDADDTYIPRYKHTKKQEQQPGRRITRSASVLEQQQQLPGKRITRSLSILRNALVRGIRPFMDLTTKQLHTHGETTCSNMLKYWDDPNELVERLRLLVSSASAGHTGHSNEMLAIVEELREANIVK